MPASGDGMARVYAGYWDGTNALLQQSHQGKVVDPAVGGHSLGFLFPPKVKEV